MKIFTLLDKFICVDLTYQCVEGTSFEIVARSFAFLSGYVDEIGQQMAGDVSVFFIL